MEKAIKLNKIILFSLFITMFSCKQTDTHEKTGIKNTQKVIDINSLEVDENGLSEAKGILKTTRGIIVFKFYPKHAPNTTTRLIQLINTGFYDGLIFHRVIPGFIIQTGDPTNEGKGGSGQKIKAEFSDLQHIKGTLAMARSRSEIDSADSQFYISLGTLPHLNKKYTIFGQVIRGFEVLDMIQVGDKILSFEFLNKKKRD